jgi:hypothetical protein
MFLLNTVNKNKVRNINGSAKQVRELFSIEGNGKHWKMKLKIWKSDSPPQAVIWKNSILDKTNTEIQDPVC